MIKWLKEHRLFFWILCIGFLFRCYFIIVQGLTNDELSAWNRTQYTSWNELWYYGIQVGDMHPAFYHLFLWIWVHLFGDSEWSLRSTGLLFFVLNSSLIYRIANRYFTRFSGLVTLALLTGLSFAVMNSVFARPYNSGEFFVLVSFLSILEIKHGNNYFVKWTFFLFIGLIGAMLSHYFAFLTAGLLGICALFFIGKTKIKWLLIAGSISFIVFLPHLSVTLFHLNRGGLNWLPPPTWKWAFEFIYLYFNESLVLIGVFIIIFAVIVHFRKKENSAFIGENKKFGIAVFLTVFVVAFVLSYALTPILRESAMVFILPFLFLGIIPSDIELKEYQKWLLLKFILVLSIVHSVILYRIQDPIHFGVFREQAAFIHRIQQKYGAKNIEFASAFNHVNYLNYYLEDDVKEPIVDWTQNDALFQLKKRVDSSTKSYFCFSESTVELTPMYQEVIRSQFPHLEASLSLPYSTAYFYSKGKNNQKLNSIISEKSTRNDSIDLEFFGDLSIEISHVTALKKRSDYYVLQSEGSLDSSGSFYLVATIVRDNEMLMKNGQPYFYHAIDLTKIETNNDGVITSGFRLPKDLKGSDVLKIYAWNPQKKMQKLNPIKLYLDY